MPYTYLAAARLNARPKLPPEPPKERHAPPTEEALAKAMAQAARAENDAMQQISFGQVQRNHYTGPSMEECIEQFANACGTDGKTMVQLEVLLGINYQTLKGHSRNAQAAGAVRKVQAHKGAPATFYDARGQ